MKQDSQRKKEYSQMNKKHTHLNEQTNRKKLIQADNQGYKYRKKEAENILNEEGFILSFFLSNLTLKKWSLGKLDCHTNYCLC